MQPMRVLALPLTVRVNAERTPFGDTLLVLH